MRRLRKKTGGTTKTKRASTHGIQVAILGSGKNYTPIAYNVISSHSTSTFAYMMQDQKQGPEAYNRLGNYTYTKYIDIRYAGQINTAGAANQTVRFVLVQDRKCRGALPAVTDVLSQQLVVSDYNLGNTDRFKILWDKTVVMNNNAAHRNACFIGHRRIKVNSRQEFSGNTGNVGDAGDNALFLLQFSDIATGANPPTTTVYGRMYRDNVL